MAGDDENHDVATEFVRFCAFVDAHPETSIVAAIRAVQFGMLCEGKNITGVGDPVRWTAIAAILDESKRGDGNR